MGWSFTRGATRADIIKELTETRSYPEGTWRTLAHTARGNVLYQVREVTKAGADPQRYIGVSLLAFDRGCGWGSKDMDESMGPCEVACPLAYLGMVPDPGSYATKWREDVRAFHAKEAATRSTVKGIAIGDTLKLREGCRPRVVLVTGRSGRSILGTADGIPYRIPPRALDGAEIVKEG